ncbi:bifunctional 4-hydroxy-2-oxoglutarate aldolase/2-dehydro-3-deoxy-phosphogluconate aldolase [Roseofilum casamattae]|uniref:Bifunctional 4-hydroxy-2-oxoglutarate aldolase/2-dehydro-3-deoxy-phosphogluconate aldolase n=1 Tax=Roseofilum casamattae BLCC-M143 TaxID=3022442 RepID=A0ABT7BXY8_9CYAN|nr:bifunctional 4-hydroxy-2-oxoglutarate aldolase/2-dehydro-3-deoxy-phosphogluconate aldolase [Roseofilum casamattae]MDJ1184062.1 bifunctional 4-hydroxy-2-oxoglutarate aldolase/2-dehydro-3-deoxy-phosphogluconate aldolase [Roseofilum casamattae BLCC-M143]
MLSLLQQHKAIAVIRTPSIPIGYQLAQAVASGGIRLIEITWNSNNPGKMVQQLQKILPECIIGAGTLINSVQVADAIDAGAKFLFSPHTNPQLIQQAIAANIPMIPGALTPTEITTAWQAGASCVKVFPIQAVGGVNYIKALQGPLGQIPLIPTGGVTLDNAADFIGAGACGVGLSSQLFPRHLIAREDWQAIANNTKNLVDSLKTL